MPTNNKHKKEQDGYTIWISFIKKSISLLYKKTGLLCVFIPSIWLKPDKEKMHEYLIQYDIRFLNCISNTETNRIFKGNAQTPSCFFLLTKKPSTKIINIYDHSRNKYVDYNLSTTGLPIPVYGQEIVNKLQPHCYLPDNTNISLVVIKTNMPPKNTILSSEKTDVYKYPNISTCRLKPKTNIPELIINYSKTPLVYFGVPKLILAHKMYGFPYLDISGDYGICNRDNYVILKNTQEELLKIQKFLSTKTALYLFEATRYRMKYLEKYAFQLIPDITQIMDFPIKINDETIADYFQFDKIDRKAIQTLHNKDYQFFI